MTKDILLYDAKVQGNVLVTGASRGMGFEFIRQFLENPSIKNLIATYRNVSNSEELIRLADKHKKLRLIKLDITNDSDIKKLKMELSEQVIDYLILNAAIYDGKENSIKSITVENLTQMLQTNTIAPIIILQTLLDNVIASDGKTVMCVSSSAGSISSHRIAGKYSYRASKAALNSLMKNASLELEDKGVKIIIMHPGWVKTDMGGQNASIEVYDTVFGMIKIIENANQLKTGCFLDYQGNSLLW